MRKYRRTIFLFVAVSILGWAFKGEDNPNCKLELRIETHKQSYSLLEPVFVTTTLKNVDPHKAFYLFKRALEPAGESSFSRLYWSRDGATFHLHKGARPDSSNKGPVVELRPDQSTSSTIMLLWSAETNTYVFPEPGNLHLKVAYNISLSGSERWIESNTLSLAVTPPTTSQDAAAVRQLMQNPDRGRFIEFPESLALSEKIPTPSGCRQLKGNLENSIRSFLIAYPTSIHSKYLATEYLSFYARAENKERVAGFQPFISVLDSIDEKFPLAATAWHSLAYYYAMQGQQRSDAALMRKSLHYIKQAQQYFPHARMLGKSSYSDVIKEVESAIQAINK
jgi:hypothetical protein